MTIEVTVVTEVMPEVREAITEVMTEGREVTEMMTMVTEVMTGDRCEENFLVTT